MAESQSRYNNVVSLADKAEQDCQERIKKLTEDLHDSEMINRDLGQRNGDLYQQHKSTLQALSKERTSGKFLAAALNTASLERDDSRALHKELAKDLQGERNYSQNLRLQLQSSSNQLQAVRDELQVERIRGQVRSTKIHKLTEQLRAQGLEPVRLSNEGQ